MCSTPRLFCFFSWVLSLFFPFRTWSFVPRVLVSRWLSHLVWSLVIGHIVSVESFSSLVVPDLRPGHAYFCASYFILSVYFLSSVHLMHHLLLRLRPAFLSFAFLSGLGSSPTYAVDNSPSAPFSFRHKTFQTPKTPRKKKHYKILTLRTRSILSGLGRLRPLSTRAHIVLLRKKHLSFHSSVRTLRSLLFFYLHLSYLSHISM